MLIHAEKKPYDKSIYTGEEPYICDFIIVSFIKKIVYKKNPLSNLLVKINYFVQRELLAPKLLLIQCLNHICLFCSVKLMLIIFKEQHLYFSLLCVLSIQLRLWTSHIQVEHCSMMLLTRLCYTLFWSQHQIVINLVKLGCKGNDWYSCFHMLIVMIVCFFKILCKT